jgi:hypothetical protein
MVLVGTSLEQALWIIAIIVDHAMLMSVNVILSRFEFMRNSIMASLLVLMKRCIL